jgi:hypothetical protein
VEPPFRQPSHLAAEKINSLVHGRERVSDSIIQVFCRVVSDLIDHYLGLLRSFRHLLGNTGRVGGRLRGFLSVHRRLCGCFFKLANLSLRDCYFYISRYPPDRLVTHPANDQGDDYCAET